MSKTDEFMTIDEAAPILGIWHTVVRWHVKRGNLRAQTVGQRNIILKRTDVEAFKAARALGLYVR